MNNEENSMPAKSRNIRVGLIRCDMHGMYYGALMAKHDPLRLREPLKTRAYVRPRNSWMAGGAHFYFYTAYSDPAKITVPTVDGFEVAKVWDEEREIAEVFADVFLSRPRVCDTFAEVSEGVDLVFIADCNGDGADHLKLATPSLRRGVPTFIDKPFAYTVKDAKALLRLAHQHRAPMMSISILLQLPQAAQFRDRFQELGGPEFGTIKGGGPSMAGHIHAISLACHLFGDGVASVECMGASPLAHVHLDYGGKAHRPGAGVVLNCDSGGMPHCAFYASAYSAKGVVHSPPFDDWVFPEGAAQILRMIRAMMRQRKAQAPDVSMLELIAVAEAARLAQKRGKRVYLREVLEK